MTTTDPGKARRPVRRHPPTGRLVEFPVVGIYIFDVNGKLVQENITFDTGGVARQLTA